MFYAFDCLYLDGRDLRSEPLDVRRSALAETLATAEPDGWIRLSQEVHADGQAFLKLACEMGLEGIIAKDRRKPYRSGRGGDWLKIKCIESEGFAIVGYEPSSAALGKLGRLLLAAYQDGALVYVGGVGTGFTAASASVLRKQLDAIRQDASPVGLRRKAVVWTEPVLVAEIAFRGWTGDGKLRHASYKGLREGADAADVLQRATSG